MAKRKPGQLSRHDKKVKQLADQLEKQGWDVQADLPGYDEPDPIGSRGHIPDVLARKSGAEKIIEVETEASMKKDKKQHEAFRRRAGQKPRSTFTIEEV